MDVRILVVEDDPKIASFVAGGLRQHAFAVDLARDGDEALWKTVCKPLGDLLSSPWLLQMQFSSANSFGARANPMLV